MLFCFDTRIIGIKKYTIVNVNTYVLYVQSSGIKVLHIFAVPGTGVALYIKYLTQENVKNHNKYQPNLDIVDVNIENIKTDDKIIKGE